MPRALTRKETSASGRHWQAPRLIEGSGFEEAGRTAGSPAGARAQVFSTDPKVGSSPDLRSAKTSPRLRVTARPDGVTIACSCGDFAFSFHSIATARRGRFRCLICHRQEQIANLIDATGRPCARPSDRSLREGNGEPAE